MKVKFIVSIILIFFCLFFAARSFAEMECPDLGQYEKALEGFKNNRDDSMIEILEPEIKTMKMRSNFTLELIPVKSVYTEGDPIDIKLRWTNASKNEVILKGNDFGGAFFHIDNLDLFSGGYKASYPQLKGFDIIVEPGKFIENTESLPFVIKPESSGCIDRGCLEPLKPGRYVVTILGGDWEGKSWAIPDNKCYAQPIKPIEIIIVPKKK